MLIKKPNSHLNYLVYITPLVSSVISTLSKSKGGSGGLKHHVIIMKNNLIILEFEDIIPNKQIPDTFTRKILGKSQEYHFVEGQLIVKLIDKATSFLKAIKVNKQINNKIITMDIESRKINNVSTPYLIAFFDGFTSYSFYLRNYNNVESMLKAAFTHLLKSKYDQHKVYLHNLSFFDGVFMLNMLKALPHCQLFALRHEGKFINLQLSYGKKYNIYFRDSLLMMPIALSKLANAFKVLSKAVFPIFAANDLPLDFIGNVPDFKYFKDISKQDYTDYVHSFDKNN
jgi:hypothetical protein